MEYRYLKRRPYTKKMYNPSTKARGIVEVLCQHPVNQLSITQIVENIFITGH